MTDQTVEEVARLLAPKGGGDRPYTWAEWWQKSSGYEAFVDGVGVVRVEVSDTETNSYGETEFYTLILSVQDCNPVRYFRMRGYYGSFGDYGVNPFEGVDLEEVQPNVQTVHSWKAM